MGKLELESPGAVVARHKVVLSHASAAAFHGIELPEPVTETHVTASRNRGRRRRDITDARLHRSNLRPDEVIVIRGVRATTAIRTAIDVARTSAVEFAVTVIDSFLRAGSFTLEELTAAAASARGTGRAAVKRACALADPECGSVFESLTRVLLWKRGICRPTSQFTLRHRASGWYGRLDFAWEDMKVALECDGFAFHSDREQFKSDRRRWNALTRLGWRLLVITWFDLTEDPDYVIALVIDVLATSQQHTVRTLEAA